MPEDPFAFRLDRGAPWLNFVATLGRASGPQPVERIATPERLAQWLARSELTPLTPVTEADLAAAKELRELLRGLALNVVDGVEPRRSAAAELGRHLRAAGPMRLAVLDRLHRDAPRTTADALGRLAYQAADWLTGPLRHDLRACPEQDCRGVFADPGGRRRWCPSPACASRGRVRALRQRRREGS